MGAMMGVGDISTILGLSMKDGFICHDISYHDWILISDRLRMVQDAFEEAKLTWK